MIRDMIAAFKRYWAPPLEKIDALDPTKWEPVSTIRQVLDEAAGGTREYRIPMPADYSVTGTPRHIPWSRRKKELEAGARQKRRHLESFREEA